MSLKLSEQIDADALAAFALYKKYLENFSYKFPASVLKLLDHPDWHGGCDSKSPHDASLKSFALTNIGTESSCFEMHLSKSDFCLIRIQYFDVLEISIPCLGLTNSGKEWCYEQFRYFDPFHSHGIKEKKMFTHDIEWVGGVIWQITASKIEVTWTDV